MQEYGPSIGSEAHHDNGSNDKAAFIAGKKRSLSDTTSNHTHATLPHPVSKMPARGPARCNQHTQTQPTHTGRHDPRPPPPTNKTPE